MKTIHMYLLACAAMLASPTFGQDGPVPLTAESQETDAMEELRKLFLDVEANLESIDRDLADAGAGEIPLDEVEDSGIDKLLRRAEEASLEAQLQIDRILEIAQQMGQGQGSGGNSAPQGESPLDKERNEGPKQQENTPRDPAKQPEGEDGEQPHDGNEPKDQPKDNPPSGENVPGQLPPQQQGDAAKNDPDAEKWGFLPDHVRETFRNQGRDELPVRYRDWIDSYYRRLSRTDR